MKTKILSASVFALIIFNFAFAAAAATTINAANKSAYAANLGWIDWRGDTNSGAVIGQYVCSGYIYSANVGWIFLGNGTPANQIQYQNNSVTDYGVNQDGLGNLTGYAYSANVGWINLGSGTPANQIQYQNNSATDYGVNTDGLGDLRGYAYAANIGWLNFENTGAPKVDLFTGNLSGSVWSANCGWISLSNATAFVQTDTIQKGALSTNGLPIAWLLQNFGTTNVNANADADGDGVSNGNEYLAGTDPLNAKSVLKITSFTRNAATANNSMNWSGVSTRFYAIQTNSVLASGAWVDRAAFTVPGIISASWTDTTPTNNFYRIRAYRPLTP